MNIANISNYSKFSIDQAIKPLLYVLNLKGYKTLYSCGAHQLEETLTKIYVRSEQKVRIIQHWEEKRLTVFVDNRGIDHQLRSRLFLPKTTTFCFTSSPYVEMLREDLTDSSLECLEKAVGEYNQHHLLRWEIKQRILGPDYFFKEPQERIRIKTCDRYPLQDTQRDIPRFAEFLWERP